jgi:glycosyltransferase involved in cell wall biosynthesis
MLDYLKICVHSLEKNSNPELTEVCIVVDGCTDETEEWLTEFLSKPRRVSYKLAQRSEQKGAYSGWNLAAKIATKSHVLVGEDDFYYCPNWDTNLFAWTKDSGISPSTLISHQLIEPFPGSYLMHDCGDGPAGKAFDEKKLLKYVQANTRHAFTFQTFNMPFMPRELWNKLGGYDEQFDPVTTGTVDLLYRLYQKPRRSIIVFDSYAYHFKPQVRLIPHKVSPDYVKKFQEKNHINFEKKWGITVATALKKIKQKGEPNG